LLKHGIPADHVDDVSQETILCAWLSLQERPFRVPKGKTLEQAVRGWVTTLATARTLSYRHKLQLHDKTFVHDDDAIDRAAAEGTPEAQVESAEVLRTLDRLKPRQRRLLMLVALGYSHDEIAVQVGGDAEAVAGRVQRARRAFQEALIRWRR
jgi:DNA-directed RNA polymerase specialized sigma24 family protein